MKRWKQFLLTLTLCSPTVTSFSCSTLLGTAVRDAAIDGTAGFVEAATAELLDRWFGGDPQDE